jgi:hypothetical protein
MADVPYQYRFASKTGGFVQTHGTIKSTNIATSPKFANPPFSGTTPFGDTW